VAARANGAKLVVDESMITQNMETLETPRLAEEVEEISLLLPSRQVMALAQAAESEGLTMGQYMRRLVNQALALTLPERKFHSA
jgi:hypothetical protein